MLKLSGLPKSLFVLLISIILFQNDGFSQDKLLLKNGKEILVKVLEIGSSEISYKRFDNLEGPIFKTKRKLINEILFENGSTWNRKEDGGGEKEKSELIEKFDEMRIQNKKLQLINDTMIHHVIMFHVGAPEVDIYGTTLLRFHGGVSYEWQNIGNKIGLRVMPVYTIEIGNKREVPDNVGALSLSLSPRYYLKNWKSSQFYLGIEAQVGSHIPNPRKTRKRESADVVYDVRWLSIMNSWHIVFGGQVTSKSNFNMNVEVGAGYKYVGYKYTLAMPDKYYWRGDESNGASFFNVFFRLAFGGRVRTVKK